MVVGICIPLQNIINYSHRSENYVRTLFVCNCVMFIYLLEDFSNKRFDKYTEKMLQIKFKKKYNVDKFYYVIFPLKIKRVLIKTSNILWNLMGRFEIIMRHDLSVAGVYSKTILYSPKSVKSRLLLMSLSIKNGVNL